MQARSFSNLRASSDMPKVHTFVFTPAEWRKLLDDPDFLTAPDNSFNPRRLMGLPVRIVPHHGIG